MATKKEVPKKSNIHDIFVKKILSDPEYCIEIFRLIFTPKEFRLFRWNTLQSKKNTYITENYKEKRTDIVFSVSLKNKKTARIILLIEHKSYQNPKNRTKPNNKGLIMQLLEYQKEIYRQENCPIIPIVIYHGKQKDWKEPMTFQEYLGLTKELRGCLHFVISG